jgi:hypothetical protein
MSIAELGSLGEFISSFAVLITLIYLAVQVKQNTLTSKSTIRQSISEGAQSNLLAIVENDTMVEIMRKLNNDESLTDSEEIRYTFWLMIPPLKGIWSKHSRLVVPISLSTRRTSHTV